MLGIQELHATVADAGLPGPCGPGASQCDGRCVDTGVDPNHCGGCDRRCAENEVCSQGSCASPCLGGVVRCADRCVDVAVDPSHCGGCPQEGSGRVCEKGQVCAEGECRLSCAQDRVACRGGCIDPRSDSRYCGATAGCGESGGYAGTVCSSGEGCSDGACIACTPIYLGVASFEAGAAPHSLGAADLNGDGWPDLAVANPSADSLSLLWGRGDGSFERPSSITVGPMPEQLVVGDVDGDGASDIVVTTDNFSSEFGVVQVLFGRGDGRFEPPLDLVVGAWPRSLALADIDRDGQKDIAVACAGSQTVELLFGREERSFEAPAAVDFGGGTPTLVAIAELFGDELPDLIVASFVSGSGELDVMLGAGSRSFAAPLTVARDLDATFVTTGSVDADDKPDIAVATQSFPGVAVLLGNDSAALFDPAREVVVGPSASSLALADVDTDGVPDLLATKALPDGLSLSMGKGGGAFESARTIDEGSSLSQLALTDLNADGRPDAIMTSTDSDTVRVLLQRDDAQFEPIRNFVVAPGPAAVELADINDDRYLDLAVASQLVSTDPELVYVAGVLLGRGDGSFEPVKNFVVGPAPRAIAVFDLDNDGHEDLVVVNSGSDTAGSMDAQANSVSILYGSGDETMFALRRSFEVGLSPQAVVVADLDGIGRADLAVIHRGPGPSRLSVLLANANSRDQEPFDPPFDLAVGSQPSALEVANLDGPGKLDLVVADAAAQSLGILLAADAGAASPYESRQDVELGATPQAIATGDLNHDGSVDLAVAVGDEDGLLVLLGNGDGTFGPLRRFEAGRTPVALKLADLNADGRLDVAVANQSSNEVSVLLGDGRGNFSTARRIAAGFGPSALAVGKVSGGDTPDLAVANFGSRSVSLLLGTQGAHCR